MKGPCLALDAVGQIELPGHAKPGGFDHAAVQTWSSRLYVAHTANDALDVVDGVRDQYLHSIPGLTGVAGVLVSEEHDLVFCRHLSVDLARVPRRLLLGANCVSRARANQDLVGGLALALAGLYALTPIKNASEARCLCALHGPLAFNLCAARWSLARGTPSAASGAAPG
jgi:hypothetical protein